MIINNTTYIPIFKNQNILKGFSQRVQKAFTTCMEFYT